MFSHCPHVRCRVCVYPKARCDQELLVSSNTLVEACSGGEVVGEEVA